MKLRFLCADVFLLAHATQPTVKYMTARGGMYLRIALKYKFKVLVFYSHATLYFYISE